MQFGVELLWRPRRTVLTLRTNYIQNVGSVENQPEMGRFPLFSPGVLPVSVLTGSDTNQEGLQVGCLNYVRCGGGMGCAAPLE